MFKIVSCLTNSLIKLHNEKVIVFSCGGTLNSKVIDSSLGHEQSKKLYFHGDSSQVLRTDLENLIIFLKKAFEMGYSNFIIEFGTDTVCKLIENIKEKYDYLERSKILCLTSMHSLASKPKIIKKYKQDYFTGFDCGVIRLVVINRPADNVFDLRKDSFELSKIGVKTCPMVMLDQSTVKPRHLDEIKMVFPSAKWIFSGPSYDILGIVGHLSLSRLSEPVILCGVGDFNFNIAPEIVSGIIILKKKNVKIYLTTIFKGSFYKPNKTSYLPRKTLEQLGVVLLTRNYLNGLQVMK